MIIPVIYPGGSYEIILERGALDGLGEVGRSLELGRRVVVASDATVTPLFADRALAALRGAGFEATLAVMPAGEDAKNWASLDLLISRFAAAGLDRAGWVVALGGGVVGDTVGLAAGLYMRGIRFVQAPTTILAMSDASIGGKVAIDHPAGKNMVGLFNQPAAVVADMSLLDTLPPDEWSNGMAEVVKAGVIDDPDLFVAFEDGAQLDEKLLAAAIDVKRRVVEEDPYEKGRRALLNLGHTFGHGFELLSGYKLKHGFGVSQGMMVAARLAADLGLCSEDLVERQAVALSGQGLPLRWGEHISPDTSLQDVVTAMSNDKKKTAHGLRFILAHNIGDVRLHADVPQDAVLAALAATRQQ